MIYHQQGSETTSLSPDDLRQGLYAALEKFGRVNRVLAVPPDQTRIHSGAGALTRMAYEYYGDRLTDIMPALGTHNAMSINDLNRMYPGIPHHLFRVHDWRNDVVTLGEIPGDFISEITNGALSYPWPAQLNKLIWNGHHDLILSIGQVVPHEVTGMANYNKNLLVGCGGPDGINKSHFLGAVYGMERIMGRADNPVRAVLNEADKRFMKHLPVLYVLTVVGTQPRQSRNSATRQHAENNPLVTRGLFIGDDDEVFNLASKLSLKVNFTQLEQPLHKVVVYLDPVEFRSTWLGNKAIYRTRMAIADGGELIILAPGVKEFGEDPEIDRLIRKYGYRGTPAILDAVKNNQDLQNNLSAAAHLIHGSSEGRFKITYCPGHLTRQEIESAGFEFGDLNELIKQFPENHSGDGFSQTPSGEKYFYISNPALGLWTDKNRFDESSC